MFVIIDVPLASPGKQFDADEFLSWINAELKNGNEFVAFVPGSALEKVIMRIHLREK